VEVSSEPLGELEPFESVHEEIPGPLEPSAQEKLVGTDWPTA